MDDALTPAPPEVVRAAIARCILGASRTLSSDDSREARLGAITLHPHQLDAVARLRALIDDAGGALLADAVGLGKTYVALAVAHDARSPLVVAPASLRHMWLRAMDASGVRATFASFETLSRKRTDREHASSGMERKGRHDFVIVDEAHHARNPTTRRYAALGELTLRAQVLLLSATPIHNSRGDLAALIALFAGARAHTLDDAELARFVVRRDRSVLPIASERVSRNERIPLVAAPVVLFVPANDSLPDSILALPPPLPPRDGDDGGVLVAHSLVRQWASSDAALRAALRRRLGRARAIESSLASGIHPTHAELRAWTSDGESQQIAFAELLAPGAERVSDARALRDAVAAHATAVRGLLAALGPDGARDVARAALLRDVCLRHRGQPVVAFASYGETVVALFARLRRAVPTAALTAAGAVVAGGALTRREALARFAPLASGARPPRDADRIELLLATDLLSEGVSLSDAAVVVHLDLPWTPARLEQRVGRAARLGSPHDSVAVYVVAPPASAEATLRVESRLRAKLRSAGRVVGVAGAILPGIAAPRALASPASPSESAEETRRVVEGWRRPGTEREGVVAQVRCGCAGFVAACRARPAEPQDADGVVARAAPSVLVASLGDSGATDDTHLVCRAVTAANRGEATAVVTGALSEAIAAIGRWADGRAAFDASGIGDGAAIRARRRVVGRIAAITRRLPAHRRVALASLAVSARRAALAPCGAGAEWVLEELARADLPDEAWLLAVRAFGESAGVGRAARTGEPRLDVVALLLLEP